MYAILVPAARAVVNNITQWDNKLLWTMVNYVWWFFEPLRQLYIGLFQSRNPGLGSVRGCSVRGFRDWKRGRPWSRCMHSTRLQGHLRNHGWKVGGDLAWDGNRSPSFSSCIHFPSPTIAPPLFHPFPSHSSSPPPLNTTGRSGGDICQVAHDAERKKTTQWKKLEGTKYYLVRTISKVGEDASHRSRRADAAPLYMMRKWGARRCWHGISDDTGRGRPAEVASCRCTAVCSVR